MKKITCLLLVLVLLLGISASSALAEEPLVITYSHFQNEADRSLNAEADGMFTMMEQYQAAHPDVRIEQTVMDQSDYYVKIQAQAAAGDLPDVFYMKGSWTSTFVDNGVVAPVNDYLALQPFKDSFRSGIFDGAARDGQYYGVPVQYTVTSIVYYNAELWQKAGYDHFPTTWDEFFEANEKFKEMGIATIAMGNKDQWPFESCVLSALGDRFTGSDWTSSIIARDGQAKFTDPEFVAALALSQKLATEGCFNADYNTCNNEQAQTYFLNGTAATSIEGVWALSRYESMATPEFLANMHMAVLPTVEGGKGQADSTSGGCGWYLAVNSNLSGEKLDAVMDFVFSVYGEGYSRHLAEKFGLAGPVAVSGADVSSFPATTQEFLALSEGLTYTPIYDIRMEGAVIETMNAGLQELLNGATTPEDLAQAIQFEQDNL